jgi:hypothetical protein
MSVRLAGSRLSNTHICAFFNSHDDEYRVTLPFIKEGFERGDRACHLVGPVRCEDHLRRLTEAGIDTVATQATGQFDLRSWEETYLSGGYFDPDQWLVLVEDMLASGPRQGFPMTRVVAHMEWALEARMGVDRLVEYEARVNHVWPRFKDSVICICTYDLAQFSGDVIIDIMRTHPMVIIGGILHQNPFYVEPDTFLKGLRERESASGVRLGV